MYPVYSYVTFNFIHNIVFVFSANTTGNMMLFHKKDVVTGRGFVNLNLNVSLFVFICTI